MKFQYEPPRYNKGFCWRLGRMLIDAHRLIDQINQEHLRASLKILIHPVVKMLCRSLCHYKVYLEKLRHEYLVKLSRNAI